MWTTFFIIKYAIILLALIPLTYIDYKKSIVPNKFILALLGLRGIILVAEIIMYPNNEIVDNLKGDLLGFLIIGGIFFAISTFYKNSIGMGDVKLFAIMGGYLGTVLTIFSITAAFIIGGIYSLYLITVKKKDKKTAYPLIPCVLVGSVLVCVWCISSLVGGI